MGVKSVTSRTLRQWLDHGEAVLIDVREPEEHAAENISGAHSMPLGTLTVAALPHHGQKLLVVHCQKGGRSLAAANKLISQDASLDIYNLEGGLSAWRDAGLPTHQTKRAAALPIDRQTQLTIGIGLLLTAALSVFVHPGFVWLTVVFGAGLTIAGLTGFCGLARLLARMPWNRIASK